MTSPLSFGGATTLRGVERVEPPAYDPSEVEGPSPTAAEAPPSPPPSSSSSTSSSTTLYPYSSSSSFSSSSSSLSGIAGARDSFSPNPPPSSSFEAPVEDTAGVEDSTQEASSFPFAEDERDSFATNGTKKVKGRNGLRAPHAPAAPALWSPSSSSDGDEHGGARPPPASPFDAGDIDPRSRSFDQENTKEPSIIDLTSSPEPSSTGKIHASPTTNGTEEEEEHKEEAQDDEEEEEQEQEVTFCCGDGKAGHTMEMLQPLGDLNDKSYHGSSGQPGRHLVAFINADVVECFECKTPLTIENHRQFLACLPCQNLKIKQDPLPAGALCKKCAMKASSSSSDKPKSKRDRRPVERLSPTAPAPPSPSITSESAANSEDIQEGANGDDDEVEAPSARSDAPYRNTRSRVVQEAVVDARSRSPSPPPERPPSPSELTRDRRYRNEVPIDDPAYDRIIRASSLEDLFGRLRIGDRIMVYFPQNRDFYAATIIFVDRTSEEFPFWIQFHCAKSKYDPEDWYNKCNFIGDSAFSFRCYLLDDGE